MAEHAKTMRELADSGLTSEERAEARINALNAKLDLISKHVDDVLAKALTRVKNPKAREAIQRAKDRARTNLKSARDKVESHKKGKKPEDRGKPEDRSKPEDKGRGGGTQNEGSGGNSGGGRGRGR
jgi:hypothetical protein